MSLTYFKLVLLVMPRQYGRTEGLWPDGRRWKIKDYCTTVRGLRYSKSLKRWIHLEQHSPSEAIPQRSLPHTFKLVSWNLQYDAPHFGERWATVVEYLQDILLDDDDDVLTSRDVPFILTLQELPKNHFGTLLKHQQIVKPPDSPDNQAVRPVSPVRSQLNNRCEFRCSKRPSGPSDLSGLPDTEPAEVVVTVASLLRSALLNKWIRGIVNAVCNRSLVPIDWRGC